MFGKALLATLAAAGVASAQFAPFCDPVSGICFQGFTDSTMGVSAGIVMPTDLTSSEYIITMVAPASYGYMGLSAGGTMANSLLFVMWPNAGSIVFSTLWTAGYVQPTLYAGPTITILKGSHVNSTHIQATFRCQNCTVWDGGSLGSGDLNSFGLFGYVVNTDTPVDDPADPASNFVEHDQFNLIGFDLSAVHSASYESYISGGATSSSAPATSTGTPTSTTSAPAATQTKFGQCGGQNWTGPTVCAAGTTCIAISPPFYSQCQ